MLLTNSKNWIISFDKDRCMSISGHKFSISGNFIDRLGVENTPRRLGAFD
jgi:hypothetical protein